MDVLTPAAVVLCGGRSRRMGQSKADLPFAGDTLLGTVARTLVVAAKPVVAVAAVGQALPPLPAGVEVARDDLPDEGPLRGLVAGLTAVAGRAEVAFVAACDLPHLTPEFVRRILERLGSADAAVPHVDGGPHPLAAAYRLSVLPTAERLLGEGRRRVRDLLEVVAVRYVAADELPEVRSLVNVNTPEEYAAARLATPPPPVL